MCTVKHFLFLKLSSLWGKKTKQNRTTCCIQNHIQPFPFIDRAKAPALLHGKSLYGHWCDRRYLPQSFYQTICIICKCSSHNVFRSLWESFCVWSAIQLQMCLHLEQTFHNVDMKYLCFQDTCTTLVCRPERGTYPWKWVHKKHKRVAQLCGRACIHTGIWKSVHSV